MVRDILKKTQPIVYKLIERLLLSNRVNHAFLLVGISGTPKKEAAIFMGQSLVCKEDKLACEKCNTCLRVANNNYGDFIYFDGQENTIKKEDIELIQDRFSRTAFEEGGKKFYIINNVDKASPSALNSLLKFLEEPNDTIAILIASSVDRVLPTIVSRCQIINFKNPDPSEFMNIALNNGISQPNAYIISNIKPDMYMFETYEEEEYQLAISASKKFIEFFDDLYQVLYFIQREILQTDTSKNAKIILYLMEILALFFKDIQREFKEDLGWYSDLMNKFEIKDYSNIILKLIEARDKCNRNNFNVSLVLDQLIYQLLMEENK